MRACLRALLQYKALEAVLLKWPYLGAGMAQISLCIFAILSDSEMPVHT